MPIQYIPYYPEPIQGQAILNNFTRTQRALKYRDNDKVLTRILRGLPLYEVEAVETVGKNPNGNLVIRGECVSACAYLKQQGIKVDLVYIDPPFASGADYAKKIYLRRNPKVAKAIEQAEQEMDDEERGFEEKMYGDIWNKEAYLNWMYENLHAIKSVMSETGSIYVHLDWHIGHYVKVLLDEIFGESMFLNEIIWYYYNKMQGNVNRFASNHDIILVYRRDEKEFTFNRVSQKREALTKQIKRVWDKEKKKLVNAKDEHGKVLYIETDEKTVDDVWRISMLQPADQEEPVDYSTQKPESLLSRVIEASSNKDMVVADFFGGSGTTAKVAHDLGRTFIHVDVGINSIQTARDRLKAAKASFEILEVNDGIALFRNPAQTMDKLHSLIPGLGKVSELDKFWAGGIHDSKKGLIPVFLPNLLDHTQKILDKPLLNRILNEALPDLPDEVNQVIVYFVDLEDRKELERFIEEYNPLPQIKVELRDLKEVLHEIVTNDEMEYALTPNPLSSPKGAPKKGRGEQGGWTIEFTRFYSDRLMQKIDAYNQKRGLNGNGKQMSLRGSEATEAIPDDEEIASTPAGSRNDMPFKPIEVSENGLELIELVSLDCASAKGKWNSDKEIKIDKKGFVIRDGEKTKEFWDGKITCKEKPLRLKVRNIAGDETVVAL